MLSEHRFRSSASVTCVLLRCYYKGSRQSPCYRQGPHAYGSVAVIFCRQGPHPHVALVPLPRVPRALIPKLSPETVS
jgi:hypothetical protein